MAIDWGLLGNIGAGVAGAYAASQGGQDEVQKPYYVGGQEQNLEQGQFAANQTFQNGPQSYYPNSTVAPQDQNLIQGQNNMLSNTDRLAQMGDMSGVAAGTLASGGAPRVGGMQLQDQIGFGIPEEYQSAIMNPIMNNLNERIMPSIHNQATQQGAFGGSRMQQQKSDATAQATEAATNAMIMGNLQARGQSIGQRSQDHQAQLQGRGQDINQNQIYNNAMNQGVNSLGTSMNQQLMPGRTQADIGQQRTDYAQQQTTADKARFDFTQAENENYLDRFLSRANNAPAGGRTQVGRDATFMDILAGAGAGSTMYNDIFNQNQQQGTQVPAPTPIIPQNT